MLLCSGPASVRTNDSDPDGSVPQGTSRYTKAQFSLPGQRKTAGRRKIVVSPHRHSPKERYPERPLTPPEKTQLPWAQAGCPRDPSLPSGHTRSGQEGPALQAGYSGRSRSRTPSQAGSGCGTRYTHPISPEEASEAKLALSTSPRAPSLVPLPQDKLGGW